MNAKVTRALWGLAVASLFAAATSVAQTFQVVHDLASAEGNDPQSGLVQLNNGDFAGTTVGGYGTLFMMDTWGHFGTIHSFNGPGDGANPHAPLLPAPDGSLYGTTMNGMAGWGTIFKWHPSRGLRTLLAFVPSSGGPDGTGARPHAPLILASDSSSTHGEFYGVTTSGGKDGMGTIFEMDSLSDAVETLHHFSGFDGATPYESLVEFEGRFYGTTTAGGGTNNGTIFRIDREGGNFTVIHSFIGRDGALPQASLIAVGGYLYGTTFNGGNYGMGTVFRLDPSGANFSVIHHFDGIEGANPHAGLVLARDGYIYGTTYAGGTQDSFGYFGSIFRINTDTAGNDFSMLHRFHGTDGAFAQARLIEASDGALYGTTAQGGLEGRGVIFRLVFVPVESIHPASGPASGGTRVAISGENFHPGAGVTFGGRDAVSVIVANDASITSTAPALAAGTLNDVLVDNLDHTRGGILKGFFADFLDVPQVDIFHGYVEKIFRNRITAGVGDGNYGRNLPATRAQMAVFLLKAEHGPFYVPPACSPHRFADVACPSQFADWIEQLVAEQITDGCGGGSYCPGAPMTRAEMAIALLKAKYGPSFTPPACEGIFLDVPCTADGARWIEQFYREGITGGCNNEGGILFFCPGDPSTRGQTAVFLTKTFNLP